MPRNLKRFGEILRPVIMPAAKVITVCVAGSGGRGRGGEDERGAEDEIEADDERGAEDERGVEDERGAEDDGGEGGERDERGGGGGGGGGAVNTSTELINRSKRYNDACIL
jgi:hypothetical protein